LRILGTSALFGQVSDRRFHQFEGGGGLPLVAGEGCALGQSIGDDDQAFGGELLDVDRTSRRDLVVPIRRDLDDRGLLLVTGELAPDALTQAADDLVLLQRGEAHENSDAVTEEGDEALLSGPEGEGRGGEHVTALQTCHIEAVAQEQGAGREAQALHGRAGRGDCIGHGHTTKIGGSK
jgi:hypothetical protein